jgi:hypothetical protein
VSDSPLPKPPHLGDVPTSRAKWLATRPAGLAALVLGLTAFIISLMMTTPAFSSPDWRISVPGFAVTAIASIVSIVRRERAWTLWLAGVGFAGAAIVLGWFLMVAIVIGATAALMLILNTVM